MLIAIFTSIKLKTSSKTPYTKKIFLLKFVHVHNLLKVKSVAAKHLGQRAWSVPCLLTAVENWALLARRWCDAKCRETIRDVTQIRFFNVSDGLLYKTNHINPHHIPNLPNPSPTFMWCGLKLYSQCETTQHINPRHTLGPNPCSCVTWTGVMTKLYPVYYIWSHSTDHGPLT